MYEPYPGSYSSREPDSNIISRIHHVPLFGGFRNEGFLMGVLVLRESHHLGHSIRGPLFS